MNKMECVSLILKDRKNQRAQDFAQAFAPTNIALTKYWGKRSSELNLPMTDSLSVALPKKGTTTKIQLSSEPQDDFYLNSQPVDPQSDFHRRLVQFLDLFRIKNNTFKIETHSNIPIAAGLASSASGFCALVKALDQLFAWHLSLKEQSILARLGSGSACRSIAEGFVLWHRGEQENGMDSYAEPLKATWPGLRLGLYVVSHAEKPISSRLAMQRSVETSRFYQLWTEQVASDIALQHNAIKAQDFQSFGQSVENNALAMHATMHTAIPPFSYWLPETVSAMSLIWKARADGLPLFFTQDAGPNLKLLFLKENLADVQALFPNIEVIAPF